MSKLENMAQNWKYLIQNTHPDYRSGGKYFKNHLEDSIGFSYGTLYSLIRPNNKKCSSETAAKIAQYFNSYLKDPLKNFSPEHLSLDPQKLKSSFVSADFKKYEINTYKNQSQNDTLKRFANKLYRCYYMAPNSPYSAHIAFLKIFNENEACMIKGIRIENLKPIQDIFYSDNFRHCKTLNNMKTSFLTAIESMEDKFKPEQMHFYKAQKISIDTDCIRIDFISEETSPCYTTIFWNVSIANKLRINPYIGGSALAIDTNQGNRGKDICSYKLGIETLENSRLKWDVLKNPFDCSSVELINELSLTPRNGISVVDNADDNRFFRFITENYHRVPDFEHNILRLPKTYSENDIVKIIEHLAESHKLLKDEIYELKSLKNAETICNPIQND